MTVLCLLQIYLMLALLILTPAQVYLALSDKATVTTWSDVDPSLPAVAIKVFIPGTKHGTREVFDIKVMEEGCKATRFL
jgi:phosphate transport system substrate-binding protein